MKTRNKNNQIGSVIIWFLLVMAIVLFMYLISNRIEFENDETQDNQTTSQESSVESSTVTKSFKPVNNYDSSRGKALITDDKFNNFKMEISAAMPSEFPGTYYESFLKVKDTSREVYLGKMNKTGGVYKLEYVSSQPLAYFSAAVIKVDGNAETVEGKRLPHEVMIVEF